MIRLAVSTAAYLVANAAGLLAAVLLLDGFSINFVGFITAVLIFSLFQTVLGPLVTKMSVKYVPQLTGGIALVTIFFGLLVTQILVAGMHMGGIANWLAATLLVWLGSLIAAILLPIYVFKTLQEKREERRDEINEGIAQVSTAATHASDVAEKAKEAADRAMAAAERAETAVRDSAQQPKPSRSSDPATPSTPTDSSNN